MSFESQSITQNSDAQLSPSGNSLLVELAEAKLRLRRYRSGVLGSGKAAAVSRLLDGILWLEAAEREVRL